MISTGNSYVFSQFIRRIFACSLPIHQSVSAFQIPRQCLLDIRSGLTYETRQFIRKKKNDLLWYLRDIQCVNTWA